jgi:hypothetical protein
MIFYIFGQYTKNDIGSKLPPQRNAFADAALGSVINERLHNSIKQHFIFKRNRPNQSVGLAPLRGFTRAIVFTIRTVSSF